jgi:hypothetical protein
MKARKIALSCLALSVPLALAGCSSSGSGAATGAGSGATGASSAASSPAAPATSAVAAPGAVQQLTGTQLAAQLLQASDLPSGFAPSTGAAADTGARLATGAAKYSLASLSCNELVNDFGQAGFGESAMASNVFANSANGEIFEEAVYQFATTTEASTFYSALKTRWLACGTFTASDNSGDTGSLTVSTDPAPSGVGQEDFAFTMKGTAEGSKLDEGSTIALEGTDVYAISPGEQGGSLPADLDQTTLTQKLISSVTSG